MNKQGSSLRKNVVTEINDERTVLLIHKKLSYRSKFKSSRVYT
jgi:hypothetical protein